MTYLKLKKLKDYFDIFVKLKGAKIWPKN